MRTIIVFFVLIVLAVIGFFVGISTDVVGLTIAGTCAVPFFMFWLGWAVGRAGVSVSISRGDRFSDEPDFVARRAGSGL
jgi:hypothetical protein